MAVMNTIEETPQSRLSIGQIAAATGVPKSTIRHWEREFSDFLETARSPGNQRVFAPDAAEKVEKIKLLVEEQGMTLRGVRRELERLDERERLSTGLPRVEDPTEEKARRLADLISERLVRRLME